MTNVWAIVLNYNGDRFLQKAVESLVTSRLDGFNLTVLVVDNASSDNSYSLAQKQFAQNQQVQFAQNSSNLGFAAGNNVGIRQALSEGADFVFLLNSDATVGTDTLRNLLQAAQEQKIPSVLCPVITNTQGEIWYAGAQVHWWRVRVHHQMFTSNKTKTYPTQIATGAAILIDARVFAQIGLWDEAYFLYYEDADFSMRARIAGCFVGVVPTTQVTHYEVSNRAEFTSTKIYWLVCSGLRFFATHAPDKLQLFWYPIYNLLRKTKNRLDTILRKNKVNLAVRRAWQDNLIDSKNNYQTKITLPPKAKSKKLPTLTISIVHYKNTAELSSCLVSVRQFAPINTNIIIVNHSSADITNEINTIKNTNNLNIQIINQPNLGFGAGHNTTLTNSNNEIALLLNPDTQLTMSLDNILMQFHDKSIGIIAPQLITTNKENQHHCHGKIPTVGRLLANHLRKLSPIGKTKQDHTKYTQSADWVSGGAMFVRQTDFKDVGGFDENFFLYFEDVDLCVRLRKAGKKVLFIPTTCVTHIGGTSFGNRHQQKTHYDQSQDYYFCKHHSKTQAILARTLRKIWRILCK